MKTIKQAAIALPLLMCVCAMAQQTKYSAQQVPYPNDGDRATLTTLTELRGVRYMEFMLVGGVPVDGAFMGTTYNTTPYNRAAGSKDSAPQAIVDKLNPAELAQQNKAAKVWLNPPRQWLLDNVDIPIGEVRDFGGLKAAWCAVMAMPKGEWAPWTTTTIARKSKFSFNKGTTVYLVDDPHGTTYIMKSVSPAVDKSNTYENIAMIATRLQLPAGWKYRTAVLNQDLILIPEGGVATILKDNLGDVYDITGKGFSNFRP